MITLTYPRFATIVALCRLAVGRSFKRSLWELLAGGQLVDVLNTQGRALPCDVVLQVFYQVCRAVQHMHRQKTPIVHRDLKVCGFH